MSDQPSTATEESVDVSSARLAWVDTETTGLNPFPPTQSKPKGNHRVIDVCVILTDTHLNVLDEYSTKIKLSALDRAAFDPGAIRANGFTDQEWEDAPPNSEEIWRRIKALTHDAFLCGHSVKFDADFLSCEMERFRIRPSWDRRVVDTTCHSIRVMQTDGLVNAKLDTAYPALKGPPMPAHRARADVLRSMWLHYAQYVSKDGRSPAGSGASFLALLNDASKKYLAELQHTGTEAIAVGQ